MTAMAREAQVSFRRRLGDEADEVLATTSINFWQQLQRSSDDSWKTPW